jgi:hypothetical protein
VLCGEEYYGGVVLFYSQISAVLLFVPFNGISVPKSFVKFKLYEAEW